MIATALILAVGVGAAAQTSQTPNLYRQPAHCGATYDRIVQRQQAALRDRPKGPQYAVLRKVDGCALSSPMGYHPDYLLPGKSDAPAFRPAADTPTPAR